MKISKAEGQRLIDAPKSAGSEELAWTPVRTPGTSTVFMWRIDFALTVEEPPSGGALLVEGQWYSANYGQIRLCVRSENAGLNITRLCLCDQHPGDLHWHHLDQCKGQVNRISVSDPPGRLDDVDALLFDTFIPTLNITDFARGML